MRLTAAPMPLTFSVASLSRFYRYVLSQRFGLSIRLILVATGLLVASARPRLEQPQARVKAQYLADLARLDSATAVLRRTLATHQSASVVQLAFCRARLAYKRVEWLTEYYFPVSARNLNGPPVSDGDIDDHVAHVVLPDGFQVIEDMIFPFDPAGQTDIGQHLTTMQTTIGQLRRVASLNQFPNGQIFDAMRLEIFRLITLGITGFDSPVALQSLPETEVALDGLRQIVRQYPLAEANPVLATQLDSAFGRAMLALRHQRFNTFDRLTFIQKYAYPLSRLLVDARVALNLPVPEGKRFLAASARTLSDSGIFNPMAFAEYDQPGPTPARVALGKMLFYSPALSGSARTCATCHRPDRAFTDGEPTALAIGGDGQRIRRNTPTLLNAGLQSAQFMDLRVFFLEDQIDDVVHNPLEMGGSVANALIALQRDTQMTTAFQKAYADGLTGRTLKNALATYVRSLVSLDAQPDRYLRGEPVALSTDEKRGFNLFMGKAKCATCHYFPLFNGTVPPAYSRTDSEIIGVPATADERRVDADSGRYQITRLAMHRRAFKIPTVRQVARTAPYMHNGVYQTLEQVVEFYNKGGGRGLGFALDNQTLPDAKLHLTPTEKRALVAFMKSL